MNNITESNQRIEYLMFDGTVKTELTKEDQINCKGILTHTYFDSTEEAILAAERWKEKMNKLLEKNIQTNL